MSLQISAITDKLEICFILVAVPSQRWLSSKLSIVLYHLIDPLMIVTVAPVPGLEFDPWDHSFRFLLIIQILLAQILGVQF